MPPCVGAQDLRSFNPRSPRGERPATRKASACSHEFQSTLPARGATHWCGLLVRCSGFNPRSPRGERLRCGFHSTYLAEGFNPRSPRGERPVGVWRASGGRWFQSTLPARGATNAYRERVEYLKFQSTLPARGATIHGIPADPLPVFQSTLPARGATSVHNRTMNERLSFNPRSPRGERHGCQAGDVRLNLFQSTLPARGATRRVPAQAEAWVGFNPRSPRGERRPGGSGTMR